jgi:hypothetical protein
MMHDVRCDLLVAERGFDGVGDQIGVVAAAIDGLAQARCGDSGFPHRSILPCKGHLFHTGAGGVFPAPRPIRVARRGHEGYAKAQQAHGEAVIKVTAR